MDGMQYRRNTAVNRNNNVTSVIVVLLLAIALLNFLAFALDGVANADIGKISTAQDNLAQAQSDNQSLQSQRDSLSVEWRNAQGRLSFKGDGSGKVCYLTFDDGPCDENTPKNLEILKEKGAVATWFCLANTDEYQYLNLSLCKDIEAQGSAIGIHDWDQNSSYNYYKGTVDNYFKTDFNKAEKVLEDTVGHEIYICRFAGGSSTIGYYNSKIGKTLPQAVLKKGYQYFDWNVLAGDSDPKMMENGKVPADKMVSYVLDQAEHFAETDSPICILMHDNPGKETTTEALPEIIDGLKDLGYEFKTLDYDSPGFYQGDIL